MASRAFHLKLNKSSFPNSFSVSASPRRSIQCNIHPCSGGTTINIPGHTILHSLTANVQRCWLMIHLFFSINMGFRNPSWTLCLLFVFYSFPQAHHCRATSYIACICWYSLIDCRSGNSALSKPSTKKQPYWGIVNDPLRSNCNISVNRIADETVLTAP